jgi:predicted PurR-regulated permease PerM
MASEFEPRPAPPHQVAPAETPTPANLVTLAGAVVGLVALYVGRDVFLPIVLAVLLAFVLAPFVDLLRRWYLGRALSVAVAVILALAILSALAGVTGLQLAQFAGDLPRYRSTIAEKVTSIRAGTLDRIAGFLTRFNREVEQATQTPPSSPAAQQRCRKHRSR